MEVLLLLVMGMTNIFCFMVGARVGQKVAKDEEIKLPSFNPMDAIKAHEAKKEAEYQQSRFDTIMRNIDGYDGSSNGQEDVPWG